MRAPDADDRNPHDRVGIILAGGTGSRLRPITTAVSKQLLPVYDKPMIYYPLSTLMLAGITEILIITTPQDRPQFERLLGDGASWGLRLSYRTQDAPRGLAEAFLIGEEHMAGRPVCLVLGDNLFYGDGFSADLQAASASATGGRLFAQQVSQPEHYGVVTFDDEERVVAIEEKPSNPRSNWAITGLYFLDARAVADARAATPSDRGELEITSVLEAYLARGELQVTQLGRGFAWLDTGTFDSMLQAAEFVSVIDHRQGVKVGSPEEIAYRMGYIDRAQLLALAEPLRSSGYGDYLAAIVDD